MAESGSVGAISLDLVIKGKISQQLDAIKKAAEAPAARVGEAIEAAISKPMEKAGKTVGEAVSKAVKSADKAVGDDVTAAIDKAMQRMKEQEQAINEAASAVPRAVEVKTSFKYDSSEITAEVDAMCDKIGKKTSDTVESINEKLEELGKFEVESAPTQRLKQEIELTTEKIELLQKKWQELSAAEPTDKIVSQLSATEQRIISAQNRIDRLRIKLEKLSQTNFRSLENSFGSVSETAEKSESRISKSLSSLASVSKSVLGAILKSLAFAFKSVGKISLTTLKGIGKSFLFLGKTAVKTGGLIAKGLGKGAVGAVKKLGGHIKSSTSAATKFGSAIKRSLKNVFLFSVLYTGFRALKDGLLEAAKADKQFSDSLNAVKANLAIAFTPIMQAIMPALNTLMSGLAVVTKQVAGFISGLFGKTYQQAAAATKKLKSTADAAKKAKMSMAGIDEMNVLSGGDDDSSGSDDGGVDYSKLDMSEPELPDWAEKLKESIKGGDWKGVGSILADRVQSAFAALNWDKISAKLNSGISKVTDVMNGFLDRFSKNGGWNTLGDTVAGGLNTITSAVNKFYGSVDWSSFGSGIATGLNRAIAKTNWTQLGKALSAKIRAVIDTGFAFVTTFDFKSFGKRIGDGVNGFFDNIDFGKAGKTLSEGVKGLLDTAINFVQTVNWRKIGEKIAEFLANIDWGGIASRVFELLGSALGGAVSLLWGAIKGVVKSIKEYFSEKIEEAGGNVILGLLNGIVDGLKSIGKWISDHIFKPFINGFKKAFGIHSPSKKMAEMGGYIIQGLLNAISGAIDAVVGIFRKLLGAILEVFMNINNWFKEKFQEAWDAIAAVWSAVTGFFSGIWDGIKAVFESVADWFSEKFRAAFDLVVAVWTAVNEFFGGIWDGIKEVFSAAGGWFEEQFQKAWDNVSAVWAVVTKFFSDIWDNVKKTFSEVGDWFKKQFEDAWNNITAVWSVVTKFFSDIWTDIKKTFSEAADWFRKKFRDAWENVKAIWSVVKKFFADIWDGIKKTFSKVGSWFREKFQEAVDNVKAVFSIIGSWFGDRWNDIKGVFSKVGGWFKEKFQEAYDNVTGVFTGIKEFFSGIWDKIKDVFSSVGSKIGDAFSNAFKTVVNSIFEWIEGKLNFFIDMINGVIGIINEIPGVDLGYLDYFELPRLAKGGLATAPTLAMVGDNRNARTDPEVIAPLSKLQGMMGGDSAEIVELLKVIIELLRSGMSIEIINYMFRNSKEFSREVINAVNADKARGGK